MSDWNPFVGADQVGERPDLWSQPVGPDGQTLGGVENHPGAGYMWNPDTGTYQPVQDLDPQAAAINTQIATRRELESRSREGTIFERLHNIGLGRGNTIEELYDVFRGPLDAEITQRYRALLTQRGAIKPPVTNPSVEELAKAWHERERQRWIPDKTRFTADQLKSRQIADAQKDAIVRVTNNFSLSGGARTKRVATQLGTDPKVIAFFEQMLAPPENVSPAEVNKHYRELLVSLWDDIGYVHLDLLLQARARVGVRRP